MYETGCGNDVHLAAELLGRGELVAIPTETVYGLAGNALIANTVAHIFEVKDRPHFDPLIVHMKGVHELSKYVAHVPQWAEKLAEAFWPGPLSMVLEKNAIIPDIVTAGLATVAVRVPAHPLALELLHALDFPLAAPSANPFGYVSPTNAHHVMAQLDGKIPFILDGGDSEVGIESTIVAEIEGAPSILRLGGTSVEAIMEVIGDSEYVDIELRSSGRSIIAPGMTKKHYSPHKRLYLGDPDPELTNIKRTAALRIFEPIKIIAKERQIVLSPEGDMKVAAASLFAAMRKLDTMDVDAIFAELAPPIGIGRAINDRLTRASVHH